MPRLFNIRLTDEEHAKIKAHCFAKGVKMSTMMKYAMFHYMEQDKVILPKFDKFRPTWKGINEDIRL